MFSFYEKGTKLKNDKKERLVYIKPSHYIIFGTLHSYISTYYTYVYRHFSPYLSSSYMYNIYYISYTFMLYHIYICYIIHIYVLSYYIYVTQVSFNPFDLVSAEWREWAELGWPLLLVMSTPTTRFSFTPPRM